MQPAATPVAQMPCCPLYLRDSPRTTLRADTGLLLRWTLIQPAHATRACTESASLQLGERPHPCGRLPVLLPERSATACAFGGPEKKDSGLSPDKAWSISLKTHIWTRENRNFHPELPQDPQRATPETMRRPSISGLCWVHLNSTRMIHALSAASRLRHGRTIR